MLIIDLNSLRATIRSMCGQYRELWTANKSVEVVDCPNRGDDLNLNLFMFRLSYRMMCLCVALWCFRMMINLVSTLTSVQLHPHTYGVMPG